MLLRCLSDGYGVGAVLGTLLPLHEQVPRPIPVRQRHAAEA